jgi:hypothetical protein
MNIARFCTVVVPALGLALAIGWVAFQLQQQEVLPRFFFPLIFPILVGAAMGGICAAMSQWLPAPRPLFLPLIAFLAGMAVVFAETWCSYRFYVTEIEDQIGRHPLAAAARGAADDFAAVSFCRFIAVQIERSNNWWLVDAGLTVGTSAVVGWLFRSSPNAKSEI